MEDAGVISSSTKERDEGGNENTDGRSPLVQIQVYEPPKLFFRVCTKPVTMLRRTTLRELQVNEPSEGCYLFLRTLGPIFRGTVYKDFGQNVTFPVEDHARNRSGCCLHGHVHIRSERELPDLLPVNTVFVLKEPFLVVSSEQNFTVLVGSPSDFVLFGRSHILYEDAEALGWREKTEDEGVQLTSKWKDIGEDLFLEGKHQEACDAYFFAMNNSEDNETNFLLNVNLTKCFLAQGCYESAINHALLALRLRPLNESALYLAGLTLYKIRLFDVAKLYFERLARDSPSVEHFSELLGRCELKLSESKGNVDIHKLFQASLSGATPTDVGTFVGDVKFPPDRCNERGVFATKDLETGTLILVENPLVAFNEPPGSSDHGVVEFLRTVLKAVLKNPQSLGRKLYCLPGGGFETDENRSTFCDNDRELEPIVDVLRLYQNIGKNIFKTTNTNSSSTSFTYLVYKNASRFRHCCLSNCTFIIYKDVITVRTCSPVRKGHELFLRYYGNRLNFREKQEALERYGLTCACILCDYDKKELTEVHDLRKKLMSRFYSEIGRHVNVSSHAEEKLHSIVRQIEITYMNRESLSLLLFFVYYDLAQLIDPRSEGWKYKVTHYLEKGLRSVGLSTALLLNSIEQDNPQIPQQILVPKVLFEYAGLMAELEYSSGSLDLVEKWLKIILLLERVYIGGNLDMLKKRFFRFRKVPTLLSEFVNRSLTTS